MLKYTEDTLPFMMHLPISSDDTLHFYRYLCTHILFTDEQFLILLDMPILDHAQQVEIYEVFNLDIPHGNYSLCYTIGNKYFGITRDETSTIEISEDQFQTCKRASDNFVYQTYHSYHLPTHQHVYHLSMPRMGMVSRKDVPYKSRRPTALAYQHP